MRTDETDRLMISWYDASDTPKRIRSHRRHASFNFSFVRSISAVMVIAITATVITTSVAVPDSKSTMRTASAPQIAPVAPNWLPPVQVLTPPTPSPEISSQPVQTAPPADPPRQKEGERASRSEPRTAPPTQSKIEKVIAFALAQVGDPYRWAKSGPNSYDCSGLVLAAFKQVGIALPHYTGTMVSKGTKISKQQLARGDIVFPSSGHVGIYLGNNTMVHASSSKGKVVVGKMHSFYTARRLL